MCGIRKVTFIDCGHPGESDQSRYCYCDIKDHGYAFPIPGLCRKCRGGHDVEFDGLVPVQELRDPPPGRGKGKKNGKGDGGCCVVM